MSTGNFIAASKELGIDYNHNLSSGTNVGMTIPPFSLSSTNQSRCDARTAYLTASMHRRNLHLATERVVTRLLFNERAKKSDIRVLGITVSIIYLLLKY